MLYDFAQIVVAVAYFQPEMVEAQPAALWVGCGRRTDLDKEEFVMGAP